MCLVKVEVEIWLKHLQTEITGSLEQKKENTSCEICINVYEEEPEEVENWIACDVCESWFYWECINVSSEPDEYVSLHEDPSLAYKKRNVHSGLS